MLELQYGTEDIERDGLTLRISRVKLCKRLRVRKQRLLDTLDWLKDQGLITFLDVRDGFIWATVKELEYGKK